MSLGSIPLIAISFILYNVIVLGFGAETLADPALPEITMLNGAVWRFTWGDFIILATQLLLFAELIKATYTSTASLINHGLSMVLFIACLVEFLLAPQAATSTFFLIVVASGIDVVAGFIIGIRVARRDIAIGGDT